MLAPGPEARARSVKDVKPGHLLTLTAILSLSIAAAPMAHALDTTFTAPPYPSDACTPDSGLAPQQWNASVGLPLTPQGTPAAQRIVIGEFDEGPNMSAVNSLLVQCDLDTVTITEHENSNGADGAAVIGAESTLDFTVVAAALPPNAEITLVNSPQAGGWYSLLVNAAEACGLTFAGSPWTGLRTAEPGEDFPAGGCIISLSWGQAESSILGSDDQTETDYMMDQLANNGVIVAVSAGDEGSGGCIGGTGSNFGDAELVAISEVAVTSNIATFTTSTPHGFVPGQQVYLGNLPGEYDGMYRILSVGPGGSPTTFTVGLVSPDTATTSINAVASVDFGDLVPQFLAIHPEALAVGGTQWSPPTLALTYGWNIAYTEGSTVANHVWWDNNANPNCANLPNFPITGGEATGGGQSSDYDMPDYQVAAATASYPLAPTKRMMPDLAALAGWPLYALANWGVAIDGAQLVSNVATLHSANASGFASGETITVIDLPDPFRSLNGTFTVSATTDTTISYAFEGMDIPRASVATGEISQSCTAPCSAADFPWTPVAGTSAATPLVVAGLANANAVLSAQGLPRITNDGGSMDVHTVVYDPQNSSAFRDVIDGGNDIHSLGGYTALTGYDMATGMGVPDFSVLTRLLVDRLTPSDNTNGGGSSTTIPPTTTAQPGDPVTLQPAQVAPPREPTAPPPVTSPGPGVLVSTGPNASTAPRVTTSDDATRKRAGSPRISMPSKRWRVPVVTVPGGSRAYAVQMQVGKAWVPLIALSTNRKGRAVLPSIRLARPGTYPVRFIDERGQTYFVRLTARR